MTSLLRGTDSSAAPRLVRHINAGNLWSLPESSSAPADLLAQLAALKHMGVEAIQHPLPAMLPTCDLAIVGMGRVDAAGDADRLARGHKAAGYIATTLHVGSGFESDSEIDKLIDEIIAASDAHAYPVFVETHRATITQDMRRTLDMVKRHPDIRFNADLSHWYTGQEMPYGDINAKFDALTPVFERVRYMHGRIGTQCCAQVALTGADDSRAFVEHFRDMWQRCAAGFLKTAQPGEILPFAPELLPYSIMIGPTEHFMYFARRLGTNSDAVEESDRWVQAQHLWEIAECAAGAASLPCGIMSLT